MLGFGDMIIGDLEFAEPICEPLNVLVQAQISVVGEGRPEYPKRICTLEVDLVKRVGFLRCKIFSVVGIGQFVEIVQRRWTHKPIKSISY